MDKVVLQAKDIDGYLLSEDKKELDTVSALYSKCNKAFKEIENGNSDGEKKLTDASRAIGIELERIMEKRKNIHVYSFETPKEQHGEVSRLIAKLRNPLTEREEFVYYIQRAFELLFAHAFSNKRLNRKRPIIQKTPVTSPIQNYAVHSIPDIDDLVHQCVMCVMLRGALLPSMIISKEIEDYSSDGYITPFALFKVKRDESRNENDMEYVLSLNKSFFDLKALDGKDLIFADPMNATGGSLLAILGYLEKEGVKPRSIKVMNLILSLKGALRISRMVPDAEIYTLWMDPMLNEKAYILPGLGDAGDRLNGIDQKGRERNMIQLIADYGENIVNLYRDQVEEIEKTVLR